MLKKTLSVHTAPPYYTPSEMSAECDSEYDARSSDGSDSEGSLVDFILKTDDEEEVDSNAESDGENADLTLANEFPYDPSLLEESKDNSGPRRSRRQRKAPVRYVDDKYAQLMFDDVELDKVGSGTDEDGPAVNSESEDDDYEEGSEEESDEDDSEAETEDESGWQDEEPKSSNEGANVATADANPASAEKSKAVSPPETDVRPVVEVLLTDPPTAVAPPPAKRPAQPRQGIAMVGGPAAKKPKLMQ